MTVDEFMEKAKKRDLDLDYQIKECWSTIAAIDKKLDIGYKEISDIKANLKEIKKWIMRIKQNC